MRAARGLIVAVQFLTRVPTPSIPDYRDEDFARSAVWFPFVGLIIGVAVAVPATALHDRPLLAGLAGTIVWVWITGALHLDGLADVADALGASHRDPSRFAEVLHDPHVGTFGVVAVILQVMAKVVLISEIVAHDRGWVVILVPALSRWANLVMTRVVPSLHDGLGERFALHLPMSVLVAWGAALIAASVWFEPALLTVIPVIAVSALYWRRRLGGISGDGYGATNELTESALLAAVVAATFGSP